MAKKQTRRSISVSRTTYERLKAFCEANNISMSQLVETRVNDFLGEGTTTITPRPTPPSPSSQGPRPTTIPSSSSVPSPKSSSETSGYGSSHSSTVHGYGSQTSSNAGSGHGIGNASSAPAQRPSAPAIPMTSAAARYAVEPPPPIIKPKEEIAAPKPAEKRADQIFTF